MRVRVSSLLVAGLCWVSAAAQEPARPQPQPSRQPPAQEAAVIEQSRTSFRFDNDGTGRRETYFRVKAMSDAGVQQWGQVVLGYSAATETLEIPFVRVRKADGTVVETPPASVQDLSSPVQRLAPVYTDFRQKHVTVQSFRPGDTLEVSVVTTTHTALAAGQFWMEYGFDDENVVLDEQLDIDVPASRPIILKLRPAFDPSVKEADGRRRYHWSHAHPVRDEEKADKKDKNKAASAADEPVRASVRLTTFTDWKEVGGWFAGLERAARKPSPEIQEKARQLIAGRATDLDKLEALYDFVSKNFRYVSLSLGAGRYQPRVAADVLRDAYGDCKDKHTLLAALIDAAGLQASAVLINSQVKLDPDFPSPTQFDHVITRARAGGQDVWLDATPEVAPFRLLASNLRKKQALVADADSSRLEETPADPPMPGVLATHIDGALDEAGTLKADVRLAVRGDNELTLRALFRATPNAQWKDLVEGIAKGGGINGEVSEVRVSDPQVTTEQFTIAFHVEAQGFIDLAGKKSDLALPLAVAFGGATAPESGPIPLGAPGDVSYSLKLRVPTLAKLRAPVPVNVTRDYGGYRTSYTVEPGALTLQRVLSLKQRELPQERRADFLAFTRVLTADAEQHLSVDGTALAAAPLATDAKALQLNRSGYEALEAGDYAQAVTLLQRALELDAKASGARVNLARAHLGLHQPAAALESVQKQVEINPYDEYAYYYMAEAYSAMRKYPEAEAALNKELEVNPLDKYAPGALGALFMEQQQYEKAAQAYEKASALNLNQTRPQIQLGKAYLNLRRTGEAMAAFDRAVELSPTPATWNSVAYELALGGVELDRAQRYVESAISSVAAASRNLDVEHADARALGTAASLAAYWDTLGWVYFAKGDLARAETYVTRAWAISQHAEVGDHLGQIHEKLGRREAAIDAYAASLSADAPANVVREHLARVAGGAGKVDALVAGHRGDLTTARTFPLMGKGPAGKKADFLILFAAPGRVEAVKFIEGDTELRELAVALEKIPATTVFPEDTPAKILRRGIAACNAAGACTFTLLVPEDAKPVK